MSVRHRAEFGNLNPIVLASSSPRRADLLRQLRIPFVVVEPNIDESVETGESPLDYARRMALAKVRSVRISTDRPVLGADTVVVCQDRLLGKPKDRAEGLEMLTLLSGKEHRVISAVAVCRGADLTSIETETLVRFRDLTSAECENYWDSGEPRDKAGSYGIQGLGSIFVTSICGSYSGVVGLPLMETAQLLLRYGVDCLQVAGGR